jgi:hypothetical protein
MSSLPFLSHRLFVEAIKHEDRAQSKPAPQATAGFNPAKRTSTIPLELLDPSKDMPDSATRPLRASVSLGGA